MNKADRPYWRQMPRDLDTASLGRQRRRPVNMATRCPKVAEGSVRICKVHALLLCNTDINVMIINVINNDEIMINDHFHFHILRCMPTRGRSVQLCLYCTQFRQWVWSKRSPKRQHGICCMLEMCDAPSDTSSNLPPRFSHIIMQYNVYNIYVYIRTYICVCTYVHVCMYVCMYVM